MSVLLIGQGGREHALAWKLTQSPSLSTLWVFPGNPGIAQLPKLSLLPPEMLGAGHATLALWAKHTGIDLLVVGPEQSLAEGIADHFLAHEIPSLGPTQAAARLESSKVFAKKVMREAGVPTAMSVVVSHYEEGLRALPNFGEKLVIKADGLASGKGVIICENHVHAQAALHDMFISRRFGQAAQEVLMETYLVGPEVSYMVLAHHQNFVPLATAQDHKRLLEGDQGPNTGGMGAFSPSSLITPALEHEIHTRIIQPTLDTLFRMGHPFVGILYAGLMMTQEGPQVLEFNVRLGDPETQAILPRLNEDFAKLCWDVATGKPLPQTLSWSQQVGLGVVLASQGYPDAPQTGFPITLPRMTNPAITLFHAGTKSVDHTLISSGGRVLTVSCLADTLDEARKLCAQCISDIHFEGMQWRRDIASRSADRLGVGA